MIGNNPEAAKFSGIKTDKYSLSFSLLSGCSHQLLLFFIRKIIQRKTQYCTRMGAWKLITMVVFGGVYFMVGMDQL